MPANFHKKYQASKRGFYKYLMMLITILPFVLYVIDQKGVEQNPIGLLVLFAVIALLFWIYFDTNYKIDGTHLHYKTAFIKGSIDIISIKEIDAGKTMYVGLKPAIATKGLIIKYGLYDDIYVAPENNEEMIMDLLLINSSIKVNY